MANYEDIFNVRGNLYNDAGKLCPNARQTERQLLLDAMDLQPGLHICDAPAGGGYLADGILAQLGASVDITCVEPSLRFAESIDKRFHKEVAPLEKITLPSATMDRIGSLAGLHHLEDKTLFFREVFRILKPGGLFAVADVKEGSEVATFLNGPVDQCTETGHKGVFLKPDELTFKLNAFGFTDITETYERYDWVFPGTKTMVSYMHQLFGMTKADLKTVEQELMNHFEVAVEDTGEVRLPWSLVYAVAKKPA